VYGKTFRPMPTHSASQGMRNHRDRDGRAATQTSAQQGASTVWRETPHLTAAQFMALPRDRVLVKLMAGSGASRRPSGRSSGRAEDAGVPTIFLGERLNSIHLFDKLPGPELLVLPEPRSGERAYTDWTAAEQEQQAATPPAEPPVVEEGTASLNAAGAPDQDRVDGETKPPPGNGGKKEREVGEDRAGATPAEDANDSDTSEARGMF
jgi:hypothetical protein